MSKLSHAGSQMCVGIAEPVGVVDERFPSLKARRLLAVLERQPLGYRTVRRVGSHRRMEAERRPPLTFSFHDRATIPSGLVRKILTRDVGLDEEEARRLL